MDRMMGILGMVCVAFWLNGGRTGSRACAGWPLVVLILFEAVLGPPGLKFSLLAADEGFLGEGRFCPEVYE